MCESPSRTVAAVAAVRTRQSVDLDEAGALDPLEDQLRDAVATLERDRLVRVEVDQQHLDLATISGVDRARAR